MLRQIILDTETTGLSPEEGHRIIEIGCLEMINRRLTGKSFHRYINPERAIDRGAQEVHGITSEFLADKPIFSALVEEWLDFVRDAELIIHNAPFDVGFLNKELQLLNANYLTITDYCGVIDTLTLARRKHPGQQNSLDALCRRYRVDNSNRDLHGALLDAGLLAQVYLMMTGGQVELFASVKQHEGNIEKAQAVGIQRIAKERPPLNVIHPTADELNAHQAFLQVLKVQESW